METGKYMVLVLPYKKQSDKILYCVFKRSDEDIWQFIEGDGKPEDASPLNSAKAEANKIAGIPFEVEYEDSGTLHGISAESFDKDEFFALEECSIYCFAVEITDTQIKISDQHTDFEWVDFHAAIERLKSFGEKVALRELNWDLTGKMF